MTSSPAEGDLARACSLIRGGGDASAEMLVPLLAVESLEERIRVNAAVADALLDSGQLSQAEVYSDRAFLLSNHSEAHAERYLSIKRTLGDAQAAREAWKRLGMNAARRGDIAAAIQYFNQSHYAYANLQLLDRYEYDADIHAQLDLIAEHYRASIAAPHKRPKSQRIRIAYLVYGASHSDSVLIKILCEYAKWHDQNGFDVAFFVPDPVPANPALLEIRAVNIAKLKNAGATVIAASSATLEDAIPETIDQIFRFAPDILVTTAALADYSHYLIAATRPARALVGFNFATPAQFTPPLLDWSLCSHLHGIFDSPCNSSILPIEVELPNPRDILAFPRSELGIPEDALVVTCAGRPAKLQGGDLWRCIAEILAERPQAWFVVIGTDIPPASFNEAVAVPLHSRVRFLAWRPDYLQILRASNIVLDTYPSGGGVTLLDAMALGIPIVAFKNSYLRAHTQVDWSIAEELIDNPELILPRGDFGRLKQVILRLIDDTSFRAQMGAQCAESVREMRGNPQRMVRTAEQTYIRVLNDARTVSHPLKAQAGRYSRMREIAGRAGAWLSLLAKRVPLRLARAGSRLLLDTRPGYAIVRFSMPAVFGLARWKLGITSAYRGTHPSVSAKFAILLQPQSKSAAALRQLLAGLAPESYCIVAGHASGPAGEPDCIDPLPGQHFALPAEREFGRLRDASAAARKLNLLSIIWQRGANIATTLRSAGTDTLIVCTGNSADTAAMFIASRILGCRLGIYVWEDFLRSRAQTGFEFFLETIEQLVTPRAGLLLSPNEFLQRELTRRYFRESALLPPARRFEPAPDPDSSVPAAPPDFRVVLKGLVDESNRGLLSGVASAVNHLFGREICLHIHTSQPGRELAGDLVSAPRVVIHAGLADAEVAGIERRADLLILLVRLHADAKRSAAAAATAELVDALATGKPILALCPDDSYVSTYITRHDCGIALNSANPHAIVSAIESLVGNIESRARRCRNALERASVDFEPATVRRKFIDALGMLSLPDHLRIAPPAPSAGKLRIAIVSAFDVLGIQANGFLLHKHFHERGHDSRMLVHVKLSADQSVHQLGSPLMYRLNRAATSLEKAISTWSVLSTLARGIHAHPRVRDADIVSLQLIHSGPFFSLLNLPRLSRAKRVVLSLHDMFLMTGHCVYSLDCGRWKTGCGACPDLERAFAFKHDTTAFNWKLKRQVFDKCRFDLVVGSPWMKRQVAESPLLSRFPVHYIPFGVDERVYQPRNQSAARARFGIPDDAHVIAFRSAPNRHAFKGTNFVEAALSRYVPTKPTYLITLEGLGSLDSIRGKYQFIELGWINDQARIAEVLNAADLFLMPSIAESFGLMAIESMACGTPVIVFEGTALPETIGNPGGGIAVPYGDSDALARAVEDCLGNAPRLQALREDGLRHVAANHSFKAYGDGYLALFEELARGR